MTEIVSVYGRQILDSRGRPTVDIADLSEVLASDPDADVTAGRDIDRLLGGLDTRSAGIVRAVAIQGDTAGEVGARLGMTEGAVRVALHRALSRLRARMGQTDRSGE